MEWKHSESRELPAQLDETSSQKYTYVRKNIEEETREDMDGTTYTMYVYEELAVPKADWLMFSNLTDSEGRLNDVEDALVELAEIIGGE